MLGDHKIHSIPQIEKYNCFYFLIGGSGQDITLIITSLTQVILNPESRTLSGLQLLIKREWLEAGHPFFSRTKHGAYYNSYQNSTYAPTFLLFLDCLYQINNQFQLCFEYTTSFLKELFNHAYYSQYGTFLGDMNNSINLF